MTLTELYHSVEAVQGRPAMSGCKESCKQVLLSSWTGCRAPSV